MQSYADFFRSTYAPHLTGQRAAGRIGAMLTLAVQPAGHFPDAATPDLVLITQLNASLIGEVDLGAGRFRRHMPRGNLLLAPPGGAGDYLAEDWHELLILSIPYHALLEMAPAAHLPADGDFRSLHADGFSDNFISGAITRVWEEVAAGSPQGSLFADGVLLAIAGALAAKAEVGSRPLRGGLAPRSLKQVVDLMADRLPEELTLDTLAQVAGISAGHFCTAFKRSMGVSPHRFLTLRRVERAKDLIASGTALAEVAPACGFSSQQHLTTTFRKVVGTTPAAWRRAASSPTFSIGN